ncbi:S41 family peptidase [Sorangium sp. So ce204]|uniref:S41 family peptidase n=1 Tax=Sorangium sp. So ce204 TaxID=3133288 RepID=UPI003F6184BD
MLPIANRGAGVFIAAPDVCATPPVGAPIPYVNLGFNAMASVFAANVLTAMMPTLTVSSVIPVTTGDEPGVMHPTIKGAAVVTTSFVNVFFNFLPAATLSSLTAGNNFNAPAGLIAVPSATNVFAMRAPGGAGRGSPVEEAARLARALAPAARGEGPVSGQLLDERTGYLDIRLFTRDVPARVHTLLRDLTGRGAAALLLDLRGNPGGDAGAALELAGDFLEPGTPLCTLRDEDGDEVVRRARPGAPHRHSLVVLVDRGTASASELFAGCLQAHGRALLVGEATYGKGSGQTLIAGQDGLRAELAGVVLPNGRGIGASGLVPDVAVALEGETGA